MCGESVSLFSTFMIILLKSESLTYAIGILGLYGVSVDTVGYIIKDDDEKSVVRVEQNNKIIFFRKNNTNTKIHFYFAAAASAAAVVEGESYTFVWSLCHNVAPTIVSQPVSPILTTYYSSRNSKFCCQQCCCSRNLIIYHRDTQRGNHTHTYTIIGIFILFLWCHIRPTL